uniref:Ig-like domain-containing protein n=1 Tax=Laticauda laticaudata TaxID=8630 RepID=A0A8C5SB86_LATLA
TKYIWRIFPISGGKRADLESGGDERRPGESLCLSCQASGFTFSICDMNWVRQVPGKGLEWVTYISYGPLHHLQGNAKSQLYLQMNNLKPEDSAIYYCARDTVIGNESGAKQKTFLFSEHQFILTEPQSIDFGAVNEQPQSWRYTVYF